MTDFGPTQNSVETGTWPDDAILTEKHIAYLMEMGARDDANKYLGRTVADFVKAAPSEALEFAADWLSDEQFAAAAEDEPWAAIVFAADRYKTIMETDQ